MEFGSKGLFSSSDKKHSFEAKVYREGDGEEKSLYGVMGHWDRVFVIHDVRKDVEIEKFDVPSARTTPLTTDPLEDQDPWESRLAWRGVREALLKGDMQGAADAKSRLENGQREIHKTDEDGKHWKRLFYEAGEQDEVAQTLGKKIGQKIDPVETVAAWKFRLEEWRDGRFKKPYHEGLMPDNTRSGKPAEGVTDQGVVNGIGAASASAPQPSADDRQPKVPQQAAMSHNRGIDSHADERQQVSSIGPSATTEPSNPNSEQTKLETGVAGMSVQEKKAVEDYLRKKYSTSGR